jgi:hypothetical protein
VDKAAFINDRVPLELCYHGNDVEKGSVPIECMVDALVGFSGAYAKVARRFRSDDVMHRLRVTGLKEGSARILVEAYEWARQNPELAALALTAGTGVITGGWAVVRWIGETIRAKTHMAGTSIKNNVIANGPVILIQNATGQQLPVSKQAVELLETGEIDAELDRLTAPLSPGRVDEFVLKIADEHVADVTAKDRLYFVHTITSVTTTKDNIWMDGFLNSHSKTNNRGTFHTLDGKHIPYQYKGADPQPLLRGYAYNGAVKVLCNVKFDSNMNPIFMTIYDVRLVQQLMFD